MHGLGFEEDLSLWFDFESPETTIGKHFIFDSLQDKKTPYRHYISLKWLGKIPEMEVHEKTNKSKAILSFFTKNNEFDLSFDLDEGRWFLEVLENCHFEQKEAVLLTTIKASYEEVFRSDFNDFWEGENVKVLRENGLILV